ncbi:hypothetical protein KAK06_17925 [Ideonella sp. 4Y11]|uniref:DUF1634 domain-containing protein n=1 Tax=Ideonella aquatica TaxID=2824119 RepID=A0A941BLD2_9BURK|nr:hypothetical protein [Ideonella aquatica]MBQ0960838.1 hypothetical protein [Ideonella aquatica]
MTPSAAPPTPPLDPEQAVYARWLARGNQIALAVMLGGFAAYLAGLWSPLVHRRDLASLWHLSAREYLQRTGVPTGWGWFGQLGHSDMTALLGIALLAACSLPALVAVAWRYGRRGERLAAALALLQIAVLVLAASGIIGAGH